MIQGGKEQTEGEQTGRDGQEEVNQQENNQKERGFTA